MFTKVPWYMLPFIWFVVIPVIYFFHYVYDPISKKVINLAYKWKYRKEHREMRRKYLK